MEGSAKETVIIVHGTWAAPEPGKSRWYQPVAGVPAAQPFTAKLDAALQERGSPARCWAHTTQGDQVFQWSGANSWIERTRAASALGDYVAKLQNQGWRCHIVAHSHGGNIVVEALPKIMTVPSANRPLGKLVTLGSPFMDTISPILKRAKRRVTILNIISWIVYLFYAVVLVLTITIMPLAGIDYFNLNQIAQDFISLWTEKFDPNQITPESRNRIMLSFVGMFLFVLIVASLSLLRRRSGRAGRSDSWKIQGFAQIQPQLLAIGSLMDESWQILRHMRNIENPLTIRTNLFMYIFSSMRSHISQNAEISLIHGAKSFRDLGFVGRLIAGFLHFGIHGNIAAVVAVLLVNYFTSISNVREASAMSYEEAAQSLLVILLGSYLIVLLTTKFLGATFHSAFFSPYRRYARLVGSLGSVLPGFATYIVRRKGWSVLLEMAMGLEGYRYRVPIIEQHPSDLPQNFVKYENMPECAEQRALVMRNAWIGRHLGDVTQTFSKMVVTAADITSLLREVEADQSLVHAAYYTDDECIARIADWIAGEEKVSGRCQGGKGVRNCVRNVSGTFSEHRAELTRR